MASFEVEAKPGDEPPPPTLRSSGIHAAQKYQSKEEAAEAEAYELGKEERAEGRCAHLYASGINVRQTIFMLLDESESSILATIISIGVLVLIVASSSCFILETLPWVRAEPSYVEKMHAVEITCIVVFTFEYLARVLTCSQRPREDRSVCGYLIKPMVVVDLVSILPFYIELIIGGEESGLAVVRMLRMSRIFRVLKVGSYAEDLQLFVEGMRRSGEGLLVLTFLLGLYLVVFAALLYEIERDAQRDPLALPGTSGPDRGGFESIPTTWYFIMATMTTVGYGDHYPVTPLGRFVASICMICGIFVLGLPIVIIGNAFEEVFEQEEELKAARRKYMVRTLSPQRRAIPAQSQKAQTPLRRRRRSLTTVAPTARPKRRPKTRWTARWMAATRCLKRPRTPTPISAAMWPSCRCVRCWTVRALRLPSLWSERGSRAEVRTDLYEQTGDTRFHKAWVELTNEKEY